MNSSETLDRLRKLNPALPLFTADDKEFRRYGTAAAGYDFSAMLDHARRLPLPDEGVEYIRTIPALEGDDLARRLAAEIFEGMAVQVGLCQGRNSRLNAVEWHPSSELLVAATDLLLLLGSVADITGGSYDSSLIRGCIVPAGKAVVLFRTTLHFAPVHTGPGGFKALIILPELTNAPLDGPPADAKQDPLLFSVNKWLIAHPESPQAGRGAHTGITGDNIEIITDTEKGIWG
jgi:hypothetical protein